ncbi:unknown [Ruminococcus sp. CAG:624]|nr:unknown [Ruminococcus sp. CAG:624]
MSLEAALVVRGAVKLVNEGATAVIATNPLKTTDLILLSLLLNIIINLPFMV